MYIPTINYNIYIYIYTCHIQLLPGKCTRNAIKIITRGNYRFPNNRDREFKELNGLVNYTKSINA